MFSPVNIARKFRFGLFDVIGNSSQITTFVLLQKRKSRGNYYHIYRYGMCHFWGAFFRAENKFSGGSFLVKSQVFINFGVSV